MYCTNCGKKVDDKVSFCPYCGDLINKSFVNTTENKFKDNKTSENKINNPYKTADPAASSSIALGVVAIIFSIIMPFVGLILSIIGLAQKDTDKIYFKVSLAISLIRLLFSIILMSLGILNFAWFL
jgi:hypothetical protein